MARTSEQIQRELEMQRRNLDLAMDDPMRLVILARIDRLLDEKLTLEPA